MVKIVGCPTNVGRPMFLLSNLSLDIGRNSLSYGELGNASFPTVATDHQSVKRDETRGKSKSN
jgi:hypothetical protein